MRNKVIAVGFLVLIFSTAVGQKFYNYFGELIQGTLSASFMNIDETDNVAEKKNNSMSETKGLVEKNILNNLPYKTRMIKTNGSILKLVNIKSYYNNKYGMNITSSGYNVGRYDKTTTDFEVQEMIWFKEYLEAKGIKLLYVSKPSKYIDDEYFFEEFGEESFLNRNTDLFLKRIGEEKIDYLDLRESIKEDNLNSMDLFYKGDHHWTVPAGQWAAYKISQKLNDSYGYNIDPILYNTNYYNVVDYQNSWLGEQGRLVADTYIGFDDFTMMEPFYDTGFSIVEDDGSISKEGNFDIFIDKTVYESNEDPYTITSWHYSYNNYVGSTIHNNYINYGNVLLIGDSYERTMAPFLAMGIQNLKVIIPREMEGSVRDVIEAGNYDTVIVAYAQSIIGGHDVPNGANSGMFYLE